MWPTIPKPVEGNGHPNVQKALVEMNPKKHILREIIFRLSKSEIGDFGSSAVKVTYHIQERLGKAIKRFLIAVLPGRGICNDKVKCCRKIMSIKNTISEQSRSKNKAEIPSR